VFKSVTDEITEHDEAFNLSARSRGLRLVLPDELAEWAEQNQDMVLRVQKALSNTYETLTEDQLWEVIASAASHEWQTARGELRDAEKKWTDLNKPENAPLGSIGNALDSDATNSARDDFAFSLSNFTVINEALRQRDDLRCLLSVLMVQKRMLDASAGHTREVVKSTIALGDIASLRHDFRRAARKPPRIKAVFTAYARSLLAPSREKELMNLSVPWSPKT
jgi:hypothetical protein